MFLCGLSKVVHQLLTSWYVSISNKFEINLYHRESLSGFRFLTFWGSMLMKCYTRFKLNYIQFGVFFSLLMRELHNSKERWAASLFDKNVQSRKYHLNGCYYFSLFFFYFSWECYYLSSWFDELLSVEQHSNNKRMFDREHNRVLNRSIRESLVNDHRTQWKIYHSLSFTCLIGSMRKREKKFVAIKARFCPQKQLHGLL